MTAKTYFSRDYEEARQRFLDRAGAAGAALDARAHPSTGPKGEALSTDLAWLGPPDAERVLVTISATHGVEGFCGSGAQVGFYLAEDKVRFEVNLNRVEDAGLEISSELLKLARIVRTRAEEVR